MTVLSDLYRPLRSLMIGDTVDEALVQELRARLLELRSASDEPITLLIDSPGGGPMGATDLVSLLGSGANAGDGPELRTLVTGIAGGCAADLLVAGDLAAALASAQIDLHGEENGRSGAWLARKMFPRMLDTLKRVTPHSARYAAATDMFTDEVDAGMDRALHGLSLLAGAMWTELPDGPDEIVQDAVADLLRFRVLREECEKPTYSPPGALLDTLEHLDPAVRAEGEHRLRVLNVLLARFLDADDDPVVNADKLSEAARYLDYYADWSPTHFRNELLPTVLAHGEVFFAKDEAEEIRQLVSAGGERIDALVDRAYRNAEPLWAFTLSIARSLREDGITFDGVSAWWLGLLDVVVGTDLDRRVGPDAPSA